MKHMHQNLDSWIPVVNEIVHSVYDDDDDNDSDRIFCMKHSAIGVIVDRRVQTTCYGSWRSRKVKTGLPLTSKRRLTEAIGNT